MTNNVGRINLVQGQKIRVKRSTGETVEMFQIGKHVSQGSFGLVHEAIHLQMGNRPVIIKVEKSSHLSPQLKQERNMYM